MKNQSLVFSAPFQVDQPNDNETEARRKSNFGGIIIDTKGTNADWFEIIASSPAPKNVSATTEPPKKSWWPKKIDQPLPFGPGESYFITFPVLYTIFSETKPMEK